MSIHIHTSGNLVQGKGHLPISSPYMNSFPSKNLAIDNCLLFTSLTARMGKRTVKAYSKYSCVPNYKPQSKLINEREIAYEHTVYVFTVSRGNNGGVGEDLKKRIK